MRVRPPYNRFLFWGVLLATGAAAGGSLFLHESLTRAGGAGGPSEVYSQSETAVFDVQATLASLRVNEPRFGTFERIRDDLDDLIADGGFEGAIRVAQQAFSENVITMYQCHLLAHTLGHLFPLEYAFDAGRLGGNSVDFCEAGFKHGIEAQFILEGGPDARDNLYRFCGVIKDISTRRGCYHGAGHAFMRMTRDAEKALEFCETLTLGPLVPSFTDCYGGVFAEYTNLLGGIDGDSGLPLPGGPPLKLAGTPLDFCVSLSEEYQLLCALELSGLNIGEQSSPEHIERASRLCIRGGYRMELQAACIKSVGAVGAQHELAVRHTVTVYPFIASLGTELRKAYMAGVITEMGDYIRNGVQVDGETFCVSFLTEGDRVYCAEKLGEAKNSI